MHFGRVEEDVSALVLQTIAREMRKVAILKIFIFIIV